MPKKTTLLVIALALASLSLACGGNSSQQSTAAREAITALRKIEAATQTGVAYANYQPLLIDAKAKVNEASAKLPDGELKREIAAAMEAYVDASDGWQKTMSGGLMIAGSPNEEQLRNAVAVAELAQKYNIPMTEAGRDPMTGKPMQYISKDALLSTIFKAGSSHVERASKLLGE
jgi:hypothetical protein